MNVGRRAISLDRLQRWQAYRADAFLAAFAEYAHRFCVKIDIGDIERSQFAQAQAAAVKQFHDTRHRAAASMMAQIGSLARGLAP